MLVTAAALLVAELAAAGRAAGRPVSRGGGALRRSRGRAVTVRYGDRTVLDRVSLDVAPDEVVCLLGPSGSGKSTLLQVVAGLLPPDAGRSRWDGADLAGRARAPARLRAGVPGRAAVPAPRRRRQRRLRPRVAGGGRARAWPRGSTELLDLVGLPGYGGRDGRHPVRRRGPAGGAGPRAGPRARGCSCWTSRSAPWTATCATGWRSTCATLLHRLGTPAVHVTHDLAEAELVGDRVVAPGRPRVAPV